MEMQTIPTSTSARLPQSFPYQMIAPSPVCAATISAEMTQDQEIARVTLRPERMPGSAPGRITSRMIAKSEAPRLRAARISSGSTRFVLSRV